MGSQTFVERKYFAMNNNSFENKTMVLVVDDEIDLLELYSKRLNRAGFSVTLAQNGLEAIEYLKQNHCDAVICDINMPVKNGFDVFEFVRLHVSAKVPFIFVTGHGEDAFEVKKALNLGADAVYSKPFSGKILVEHLQRLCAISKN